MVKEFLKIAGVKTQSEFYKKYPSEQAFFRAHPQARNLLHRKMSNGGIYAYADGGEPIQMSYPDYESFQAAHDAWLATQHPPMANLPAYQDSSYDPSFGMDSMMSGVPIHIPTDVPTAVAAGPSSPQQYQGTSVQDMIASQGRAGGYSTRKKLANTLGIPKYTGTAEQNMLMMDLIKQNPQVLDTIPVRSSSDSTRTDSTRMDSTGARIDSVAGNRTQAGTVRKQAPRSQGMSTGSKVAIGLGTAAGVGLAAATVADIKNTLAKLAKSTDGTGLTGQAKAKITAYRNQLRNEMVKQAGTDAKAQAKWFQKLPAEQQAIYKNLDAMEIPGDIHLMPHGTAARDLYTRDMLNEANAENLMTEAPNAIKEAEEEAKALRIANAKKAAAARWGSKVAKAAEAEKAIGLGDRFFGGLKALGESKWIAPAVDAAKGFFEGFHEQGGQHNDYSGTYSNGTYFDNGGSFVPDYGMMAAGQLPEYGMGQEMAFGGPTYSNVTQYNHQQYVPAFDWMARGGQRAPQRSGGNEQQIIQGVAQMLQQGAQPEEVLQQLVQAHIPQKKAVAIIQSVMQQMGGAQQQQQPQQMSPDQQQMMAAQQQAAGMQQGQMAYGGMYQEGGMPPDQQAMMAQQQGQQAPQQGQPDPQQIMQEIAQMLQQGAQPEQVMQQLVQMGIPEEQAQQMIQQVMCHFAWRVGRWLDKE